jgi:hypothetical protein
MQGSLSRQGPDAARGSPSMFLFGGRSGIYFEHVTKYFDSAGSSPYKGLAGFSKR